MPVGAPTFTEGLRWCAEVYHTLKGVLHEAGLGGGVGDEGGFAPNLKTNAEPFEYINKAVEKAGYTPGVDFMYAMDPASTEFYNTQTGMYELKGEGRELTSAQMVDYWCELLEVSHHLHRGRHGREVQGRLGRADSPHRRQGPAGGRRPVCHQHRAPEEGHRAGSGERHPGQGEPDRHADRIPRGDRDGQGAGYACIVSHRSGETEDSTIADLVVATNAGQIEVRRSVPLRPHRQVQPVIRIEDELFGSARYAV